MRLKGKTALITGAASGIGQETARLFAEEGARLALNDTTSLDATQAQLAQNCDAEHTVHLADVGDADAVNAMVSDVMEAHDALDVVVANAGIHRDGFVENLTDSQWNDVIRVNLTGCFNVSRAAFAAFRDGGSLVALSSVSALGNLGQANYAASKSGIEGLVRSLALEGASRNIRANAVAPGFTETPMVASIPEKIRHKLLSKVPMARMARPVEIARVLLFLASEESSFVTGQVLHVDGGASVGV